MQEEEVETFPLQVFLDAVEDAAGDFWIENHPMVTDRGCWILGRTNSSTGYSLLYSRSKRNAGYAHRESFLVFKGSIPEGLEIDHVCRNRARCNPDHLEAVTHKENIRRSPLMKKGSRSYPPKEFCKRGHPLSGDNLLILRRGTRVCRECARIRKMKWLRNKRSKIDLPAKVKYNSPDKSKEEIPLV